MNLRRLLIAFLLIGSLHAADDKLAGRICDRNGVVLVKVNRLPDGDGLFLTYPLGAFAAQLLRDFKEIPQHGETVYLTIDAKAQMVVEQALRAVPRGTAVLMNPENGDILAMASVPSFAPSRGVGEALEKDPTAPLINRAIKAYVPSATILPVTLLAGLAKGLKDFSHDCTGSIQIGGKTMKCWIGDKGTGHGRQTLSDGMKNSCNTFFYECAIAAGPEKFEETARALGLGQPTGVPLQNEVAGVIPGPSYLAKISPNEKWSDGYTANTGIGQGMWLATPLQMAVVASAFANGGKVLKPQLIDRVVLADGTVKPIKQMNKISSIDPEHIKIVSAAMRRSVNESGGNANKAATPGFDVVGRTGTSQFWRNGQKDNVTAFVGFAKSGDAAYVFSVFIEGAKSGGGVAAPLASRILTALKEEKTEVAPLEAAKGSFDFVDSLP